MKKRFQLLKKIIDDNKYQIGAEVGCANGNSTRHLLNCKSLRVLICVDLWGKVPDDVDGGEQYYNWDFEKKRRQFLSRTHSNKHKIKEIKKLSWEAAEEITDNSLDFVFVDACHEYESVKRDIIAWAPKLKDNGLLCGHDIHFPGVKRAIDELIPSWIDTGIDHVWLLNKEDLVILKEKIINEEL